MIKRLSLGLLFVLSLGAGPLYGFTLNMTGEGAPEGAKAEASDCSQYGEQAFTDSAGLTKYSDEYAYSGNTSIKMTINEGSVGWGSFGGVVTFNKCEQFGGRSLRKGDEVWVRLRLYVEEGFEWDPKGRNKFLRFRTYSENDGKVTTDGFINLYLNSHENGFGPGPYQFIFSGDDRWYTMEDADWTDFIKPGEWKTVEFYLKFDNKTHSEGGESMVRVWVDGELVGETDERRTLIHDHSFAKQLYIFTWWSNDGASKTQHVYTDDITVTTDTPAAKDDKGNRFIGMGQPEMLSRPRPPVPVN